MIQSQGSIKKGVAALKMRAERRDSFQEEMAPEVRALIFGKPLESDEVEAEESTIDGGYLDNDGDGYISTAGASPPSSGNHNGWNSTRRSSRRGSGINITEI